MTAGAFRTLLGAGAAFALLAACNDRPGSRGSAYQNPAPRGPANQGAPVTGDRRAQDAPYYTGADPAFPRGSRSGGGP
jgi:hypothetical protein